MGLHDLEGLAVARNRLAAAVEALDLDVLQELAEAIELVPGLGMSEGVPAARARACG